MNYTDWLALQCRILPDVKRAIVVAGFRAGGDVAAAGTIAAQSPDSAFATGDLLAAARLSAARKSAVFSAAAENPEDASPGELVVAFPLLIDQPDFAVLVIELSATYKQRDVLLQLLQWGDAWLRLLDKRADTVSTAEVATLPATLAGVLQAACRYDTLAASAALVATSLAQSFNCEQVAIGLRDPRRVALLGVSDNAQFDSRTNLARSLEELMEECIEQREVVSAPGSKGQPWPAHQRFAKNNSVFICSIPLECHDAVVGALVFQRRDAGLSEAELGQLALISEFLAALLESRRREERAFPQRCREVAARWVSGRPGHSAGYSRYVVVVGIALLVALLLGSGEYRVTAPASLEGRIQRAVVAPIDGFVLKAHARAGETVVAGQLIAELDDRELKLELARLDNEREQLNRQYRKGLAELNHSESGILQTRIAQVDAELRLVRSQLQRTRLQVPFDGVIIAGDLSRSLGAPVEKGQVLFEIAPLAEYRLVLQVDEREITHLRVGQAGLLYLNSQPSRGVPFAIQRLATVPILESGTVSYRTEASLTSDGLFLRPGMQGVAKVSVGERKYLWILFHRLTDWLRLTLWSWLP